MMQVTKKCDIDARTFPEIWRMLNSAEQSELRYALMKECSITRQAINNWTHGVAPFNRPIRVATAKVIKKTFGYNVSHITLFPNAR